MFLLFRLTGNERKKATAKARSLKHKLKIYGNPELLEEYRKKERERYSSALTLTWLYITKRCTSTILCYLRNRISTWKWVLDIQHLHRFAVFHFFFRYQRRKSQGKVKFAKDLSLLELRTQQKKWRERSAAYRRKKTFQEVLNNMKEDVDIIPQSMPDTSSA